MSHDRHEYSARLTWEGNLGQGTATYAGYGRNFRILMSGKPDLVGSADATFRGAPDMHNPEDLLVASLSSCHMLSYLAVCALKKISVLSYTDDAHGVMVTSGGGATGRFESVTLHPRVTVSGADKVAAATALHKEAHDGCFIANSCNFPINVEPIVTGE